ncbi:TonB-dependent receptor plug domain-containing protein [Mariniphaga sp.]|uniref:TonB-dependent receptor plug domain-containing protein n=1 Tax=Mariniphaga sp. TaxID=1954475 RepID=UPI0035623058
MISKIISFLILILIFNPTLNAQDIETWIEKNEKVPAEKIYLHTDREYYFTGETVWLKSYLTDSRSGRLIPGAENIYLHLLNENGRSTIEQTILSVNGVVSSQIILPDTLKPGNYLLQAFTDYLLNFGSEAFFSKNLSISKPALSLRAIESRQQTRANNRMVADVSFLPEGGMMLEGISNLVAFKAIDKNGFGIDATGSVKDETGSEVASFNTDYKGMGLFFMTPEAGKSYYATINGFPNFHFRFDSLIVSEGVKIQLVNQTSRELLVNVTGNSEKFSGEPFYLVNMHRGQTVFYQSFKMEGENHLLKFKSSILNGGINQLVLLDKNLKPISERLLFSDNFNLKNLETKVNKNIIAPRSEVNLNISENEIKQEVSNLSVAVVHEAAFPESGVSQNILSTLFIESELNGFIETPADFFTDNEMSATTKQRLLMLTNGWTSYFWNHAPEATEPLIHKQKAGLELHGMASEVATGQPLKNGEITLILEKDREMAFLTQNTDSEGRFTFSGLLFNDTANIIVQAKNERGKQNTAIQLISSFNLPAHSEKQKSLKAEMTIPKELDVQKYNQQNSLTNYLRKQQALGSDSQADINNNVLADGHFRIYDKADQVIEIPESETMSGNILDYLTGKVAGLDIYDNNVIIRGSSNTGGNSAPLFLVDGVPLATVSFTSLPEEVGQNTGEELKTENTSAIEKIQAIPLGDIEKVEILKSPQNLAIFGTEGANGVIAIYTRKGKTTVGSPLAKGVLEQKIAGYASSKKFYTPKYTPEIEQTEKPDFRTTLFWESEIVLQNGNSEHSFFISDQTGKYKVIVEGISESGKICIGSTEFEVVDATAN